MPERQFFPKWMVSITKRRFGSTLARTVFTPMDKALLKVTGGRLGLSPRSSVLYLTTTGRKSGRPRRVPILYLADGDRKWVMASNYGQAHHPAWSSNLLASPDATVQIGSTITPVRARLASEEEKEELWPRLLELYPSWKQYSEWTDRNFRLFCLEPRRP